MSFWSGLKSAFGFSPDDDSDYIDSEPMDSDATPLPAAPSPAPQQHLALAAARPENGRADSIPEDDALPADIFEAVVAVFNEAQPDFVRRCLSTDAQKKYIMDSISESLRRRIAAAMTASRETAEPARDTKTEDNLRSENSKLRLSLERQKRSMTDRIHNLEANISEIQAAHARETEALKARIAAPAPKPAPEPEAKPEPTPEPKPEPVPEAAPAPEPAPVPAPAPTPDYTEWEERVASLQSELNRQSTLREQAELKSRMSDQMVTEMRNMVARGRAELEEAKESLQAAEQEVSRLRAEAGELRVSLEEERRPDYKGRAEKLEAENTDLRKTIETNLYNQANNEMRLRKEIKELKARLAAEAQAKPTAEAEPQAAQKRKRGRPKKVKLDSEISDPEWFAAASESPKEGAKGAKGDQKADQDFGYHEPPRKMPNDNAAQLSLF